MANPFDVDISQGYGSSNKTTVAPRKRTKTGKATGNPFNVSISTGDAPGTDYSTQAQDARAGKKPKQTSSPAPAKQKENIFNKAGRVIKETAKATYEDVKKQGAKTVNTVAAAGTGIFGLGKAGIQAAAGDKQGVKKTLQETDKTASKLLDSGVSGAGGFLNSKQAKSGGDGSKGLKENFIKPTAKATAAVTPYVLPGGVFTKGTLAARAAKSGAVNAGVSAGTDAAAQAVDTGKVDLKQTAKSAAVGGVLGAVSPVLDKGLDKATAGKNAREDMLTNVKTKALRDIAHTTVSPDAIPKHPGANENHVTAVNMLMKTARKENAGFQKTIGEVAKTHGVEYVPGPIKSADRTFSKVMGDYQGDHKQVKDTIRGTLRITDSDPAAVKKVVDDIGQNMRVINVKNLYTKTGTGYRDIKLTLETPTGHKAEVILATPEMLKAKHQQGGHKLYEISRDQSRPEAERLLAAKKMNALYDKAHADAMSRLASASDLPKSSTSKANMSAGETSTAPSRIAPTSAGLPPSTGVSRNSPLGSERTASGMPSDSKNLGDVSIPTTVADKSKSVNGNITGSNKPGQGTSKVGRSVQEMAIARGLRDDFGESAAYDKLTIADQASKAAALTQPQNRAQLVKVIAGVEPLPDGLKATALVKAVETHPVLGKDPYFIRKLAASRLSSESSRSAQELRLARERYEHSPVEAIRTVVKARAEAIKRKTGKTAEKALQETTRAIQKAKPVVKKEDWSSFVEGLKC